MLYYPVFTKILDFSQNKPQIVWKTERNLVCTYKYIKYKNAKLYFALFNYSKVAKETHLALLDSIVCNVSSPFHRKRLRFRQSKACGQIYTF